MTSPPTRRGGLGRRLLAALALVLVTAGVTAWLVAGAVGPTIFHQHMLRSGVAADAQVISHAEEAFRTASGLALTIALAAATLASLVVSLFLTRRIGASLSALTSAARLVAGGRLDARVPPPGMGAEFDEVAGAFNQMAARLDASEEVRRRLLSDVAHELRTPVATLNAYLEGLEDGVTELNAQTLDLLRAQGARLTRLAEDLSAVTRAESGEIQLTLEPTDPVTLLHQAYLSGRDRSEALGVELRVEVDHPLPQVLVDTERIAQVLGNLVDNALRHTGTGKSVVLAASSSAGHVQLSVTDSGEGIAAQHLPHIFERFYRADSARDRASGGSGIGLAITKALVQAHGGTIVATSAGRGAGSRFEITLPRAVTPGQ